MTDVRRVVASLRGTGARLAGFALSPATAFAALGVDRDLRQVRQALRGTWGRPDASRPARWLTGDRWHATVVRLVAPPSDAFVARLRRGVPDRAPRVTFRTVDVVHTNKVMAPGRTTTTRIVRARLILGIMEADASSRRRRMICGTIRAGTRFDEHWTAPLDGPTC